MELVGLLTAGLMLIVAVAHVISVRFIAVRLFFVSQFIRGPKFYFWKFTFLFPLVFSFGQANLVTAKTTFEVYGGYQTSPHSVVNGEYQLGLTEDELVKFKVTAGWKGKSFSMPPYYGVRFTRWNLQSGWGLDFTHSKAYAEPTTLNEANLQLMQFTDGLNNVTVHRQINSLLVRNKYQTYYGYGIGVIVPHVEFQAENSLRRTFGYQVGGPTVAFNGGFKVPTVGNKFVFAEYKFTASWLDVDLNGGGNLQTRILTNALNIGFGLKF